MYVPRSVPFHSPLEHILHISMAGEVLPGMMAWYPFHQQRLTPIEDTLRLRKECREQPLYVVGQGNGQGNAEAVSSRQNQWKSRDTMQAPISSLNPAMVHDLQESFKGAHTMDNMKLLLSMGIEVSIFLCKDPCQEMSCWLKHLLCTRHMSQTDTFLSPIQHLSVH